MTLDMMAKEDKQAAFAVLLYNRGGDIAQTCNDIGISRATWRSWIEESEEFAQSCIDVTESLVDLATGKLVENVRAGNSKDIQFLLKTLGRNRGFGEKVELAHTGTIAHAHGIKYYPPEPQSIEEWEKQVAQAEKAQIANTLDKQPNSHQDAITAQNVEDDTSDPTVIDAQAVKAIDALSEPDTLDTYADLAMVVAG